MRIFRLDEVDLGRTASVGGKAANLGELMGAKYLVPTGFVITAGDDKQIPPGLAKQSLKMFDELKLEKAAVRSSGVNEDSKERSWAGQFVTILHVERKGLLKAIETCRQSVKSTRSPSYGKTADLAVIVQKMIYGDVSGVAFSVNPVNGSKSEVVIEAVKGLCEPLVQGTVTPDNYTADKQSGKVKASSVVSANPDGVLKPKQLKQVFELVYSVENHFGYPVDIEWTYKTGKLYLLQARPITTL
jgi:pyruvate,water dikinase